MKYHHYVASTMLYGLVVVLGIAAGAISISKKNWVLFVVCILAVLVSLDNFFCGIRARAAGDEVSGHYTVPKFLTRK